MNSSYYDNINSILGFSVGVIIFGILIILAVLIFLLIASCKLFQKCGQPAWAAIVPYYNNYVLTQICGLHWMYFLFMSAGSLVNLLGIDDLIGLANLVMLYGTYMCYYNLSKKFNQGIGFSVGLLLLPVIFLPLLAFSKNYVYDSSVEVSEHGVIGNKTGNTNSRADSSNNETTGNTAFCPNCGTKINPDVDRFCPNCGKEVTK